MSSDQINHSHLVAEKMNEGGRDIAIRVQNLGKCYHLYNTPRDRLKQFLLRGKHQYFREFWALRDASFDIHQGEVIGIIGKNGSGKSTLLQLICGTLMPSHGEVSTQGKIAALLELGAGFNPEFTGRENVYMNAAIMGASAEDIAAHFDEIVDFSGIRDFIDQPVKTYSSGMYVRLAFSVAISINPDILIIDEALSVGDGEFARKSFDRIMALKNAGKTILFCSHSMYQVEALCNRVIWLDQGVIAKSGSAADVVVAYNISINDSNTTANFATHSTATTSSAPKGTSSFSRIAVLADGVKGNELLLKNRISTLTVELEFVSDPNLPTPSVAVLLNDSSGKAVASAGTHNDGIVICRAVDGRGRVRLTFEYFPLLKGSYWVHAFLMCENGIYFYEHANNIAQLHVTQDGLEVGIVSLPHRWE